MLARILRASEEITDGRNRSWHLLVVTPRLICIVKNLISLTNQRRPQASLTNQEPGCVLDTHKSSQLRISTLIPELRGEPGQWNWGCWLLALHSALNQLFFDSPVSRLDFLCFSQVAQYWGFYIISIPNNFFGGWWLSASEIRTRYRVTLSRKAGPDC